MLPIPMALLKNSGMERTATSEMMLEHQGDATMNTTSISRKNPTRNNLEVHV